MKRITIILFSAYYLLAVSGVTVHYHYCCGDWQLPLSCEQGFVSIA